jgi:uncharacterized protein (TIGR04206 family)
MEPRDLRPRRRSRLVDLLALCSLLAVPWVVLGYERGPTTLLFAWGLLTPDPFSVTDVYAYFFRYTVGLPDWILAWAVGIACLVGALLSAAAGVVLGREDPRVTAGLLALVGLASVVVSVGFAGQPGRFGLPLGAAVALPLSVRHWLRNRHR